MSWSAAQVAHAGDWPLSRIGREFNREYEELHGRLPQFVEIDGQSVFAAPDDAQAFRKVHDGLTTLRILRREANMSLGARPQRAQRDTEHRLPPP